jgi:hypothetical protein
LLTLLSPGQLRTESDFKKQYRRYWNSLEKKLEPLSCSRCRRLTFSVTFTSETVNLL